MNLYKNILSFTLLIAYLIPTWLHAQTLNEFRQGNKSVEISEYRQYVDPEEGYSDTVQNDRVFHNKPINIADARSMPPGTLVTVSGWVTVTDQFAGPIFLQDETAGIASYYYPVMRDADHGFTLEITEGDSIVVTGPITEFNGLIQIAPYSNDDEITYHIYPEGRRNMEPSVITLAELASGNYESQLVRINDVRIKSEGQFTGDASYRIKDITADSELRISRKSDIPGMSIAVDKINIAGVAGRFIQGQNTDISQILPRNRTDFKGKGNAPVIVSDPPYEISATSTSITFRWITDREGTSEIRYGPADNYGLNILENEQHNTIHELTLSDLVPATVYSVQLRSAFGEDTTRTSNYYVTTSSPAGTTQEINVYFNRNVDSRLATFEEATGAFNFADHLIKHINDAGYSVDLALYSISGSVGDDIASALVAAYDRGVKIRVIVDHTTSTDHFAARLASSGAAVIESNFGPDNINRDGIHHNKYAIIDYNGGNPDDVWLITSSWNATDSGTSNHFQNMIEFQDVAIAGAYTREFNQKWGSNSTIPNPSKSRFGSRKHIVSPATFWIGDSYVRLFFSPQGNTETGIISAINKAEHTINLGTMLITRAGITNALYDRKSQGVIIRGVMGQPGQPGSQFTSLSAFADMHTQTNPLLHHKYAIIDGEKAVWNGKVITGSHNWSASANQRNDENTIIIQDARIANLYVQEFAARYHQAGGQDEIITLTSDWSDQPDMFHVHQNYPNPFNPSTRITIELPQSSMVTVCIYDMLGRKIAAPVINESMTAGSHTLNFDGSYLSGGIYFYRVKLDNGQTMVKPMTLIK